MTIGQRIKQLREMFGLSRAELAKGLGVLEVTLWKWEADFTEPRLINAICVADFFGVSLDDLVGRFECKCKRKKKADDGRTKNPTAP